MKTDTELKNIVLPIGAIVCTDVNYCRQIETKLINIVLPIDAIVCTDVNCNDESHHKTLNDIYDNVTRCLTDASSSLFTHKWGNYTLSWLN